MKDIVMLSVAFGSEQKIPVRSTKQFTDRLGEFTDLTEQLPANRIRAAVKRVYCYKDVSLSSSDVSNASGLAVLRFICVELFYRPQSQV